jgi:hypothetical protein
MAGGAVYEGVVSAGGARDGASATVLWHHERS